MKHKHNGFTLVEIILIIVVIAILASVSILSYGAIRERARDTAITTEIVDISQRLAAYNLANNNKYPSSLSQVDVTAPENMTINYSQMSDQKGYYLVVTSGTQSFSLSHQDKSPNKCDGICVPVIDPGVSTAIVATNENAPSEAASNAFDGTTSTKWLAFASAAAVTFSTTSPIIPTSYSIASANDWQSRDPRNWTLQGSNDRVSWTVIDSRSNQLFTSRYQYLTFSTNPGAYFKHYKLEITLNRDNDSATQLSEIKIYSSSGEMSVIR